MGNLLQIGHTMDNLLKQYRDYINYQLSKRYLTDLDTNGEPFFLFPDGSAGIISSSENTACIWVEYADDIQTARKGLYPWDGDGFFIKDLSPEKMLREILTEIEN